MKMRQNTGQDRGSRALVLNTSPRLLMEQVGSKTILLTAWKANN